MLEQEQREEEGGLTVSMKQLRNKRVIHGVYKTDLARALGCSYGWIDRLDRGQYSGPAALRARQV
jgi:hypothetical protein